MYSLRLFCDINKEKGEKEGKNPLFSYGIIGFPQPPENWNLARGAGSQAVRQICVVVLSLTRSVSCYRSINWNLAASPN